MSNTDRVGAILSKVKSLAAEYYRLTGKSLGVTGELAEVFAARELGLTLASARTKGHDAVCHSPEREMYVQIKSRAYARGQDKGQRMPKVDTNSACDSVMLVLLDVETLDWYEIWEAPITEYKACLSTLSAKEQGRGMKVVLFKRFAQRVR